MTPTPSNEVLNGTSTSNGHSPHTSNGHTSNSSNGHTSTSSNGHTSTSNGHSASSPASLSRRLTIKRSPKAFSSYAVSLISLPAGALFSPISGTTSASKAYSSVQTGRDAHIELNSDLLYCNHSCAPTLEFDMAAMQVRVARDRRLTEGDMLTFWYPSTEWEMAQPFECNCGSENCKGWISGAGQMREEVVREYWLNAHIEEMLREKAEGKLK